MDLFGVRELSDVFVDACLRDESGSLLMLSCYGRDTALQQLFAAFSLPASQGGLDALSLIGSDGRRESVSIERPEALKKVSGLDLRSGAQRPGPQQPDRLGALGPG
jgi:hypothetical protein